MKKLLQIAALGLALCVSHSANSQEGAFVPYSDALSKCSAEWKQSETRRNTKKGEGVAAWNDFRRTCVIEKGYVKGRKGPAQGPAAKGSEG